MAARRTVKRETSDVTTKDHEGGCKNRKLLQAGTKEKEWHSNCVLCMKSFDKRHGTSLDSEALQLSDQGQHELKQRFTTNGKGMLEQKCTEFMNSVVSAGVKWEIALSTFLLLRRDAQRDFTVIYQRVTYNAEVETVMGHEIPVLVTSGQRFYAPNLTTRSGCKSHSCLDRRARELDRRFSHMPVGVEDAYILAVTKHYFAAGFGLSEEELDDLALWVPSARQISNAAQHMHSGEKLWEYFGFSCEEKGSKQYLGQFALLALLHYGLHILSEPLRLRIRSCIEVFFVTSWGPCKVANWSVGRRCLRDYSPQMCSKGKLPSSVTPPDKRLISAFFLLLRETEYASAVKSILKVLRLPHGYSCTLSFIYCELRKYFKPPQPSVVYREAWREQEKCARLAEACSKLGTVIPDWCDVSSLEVAYIT